MKTLSLFVKNLKHSLKFEEIISFKNNVFKIEIISEEYKSAGCAKLSLLQPNKNWSLISFIEPQQMKTNHNLSQYFNSNDEFQHLFQDDKMTLLNYIKEYSLSNSFKSF